MLKIQRSFIGALDSQAERCSDVLSLPAIGLMMAHGTAPATRFGCRCHFHILSLPTRPPSLPSALLMTNGGNDEANGEEDADEQSAAGMGDDDGREWEEERDEEAVVKISDAPTMSQLQSPNDDDIGS